MSLKWLADAWQKFNGTRAVLEKLDSLHQKIHQSVEESRNLTAQAYQILEAVKKEREAQAKRAETVALGTRDNW